MLTRERSRHRRVGRTLSGKMLRPRTDLFQEFHDGVDGLFGGEGDEASQERFRRGLPTPVCELFALSAPVCARTARVRHCE